LLVDSRIYSRRSVSYKHGDYCKLRTYDEENQRIDFRKRDLVIVSVFSRDRNPKILDLSENSHLMVIGTRSLDGMEISEIKLPSNIKYISQEMIMFS